MVTQAIIPLAGLGTRLLPLSSVIPKELLPINGKPNLEYILDECLEAGIKQFIFIVPKNRPSIKKYFFNDNFYKKILFPKAENNIWSSSITSLPKNIKKEEFSKTMVYIFFIKTFELWLKKLLITRIQSRTMKHVEDCK